MKSLSNVTPYAKIFRETHLLRNVREKYFNIDGWTQGNNLNIIGLDDPDNIFSTVESSDDDEDDDEKESSFKGAINADPSWNDNVGMTVLGSPSNVFFVNAIDEDMSAFYPSIKIFSNMDPSTLLYKASFKNEEFISGKCVNRSLNNVYTETDKNNNIRNVDITGEAVQTYTSGNILTFGYNWAGLMSITEILAKAYRELK